MPILPPRNLPLSPKSSASGTGGKTGTPAAQGKSGSVPNRASPSTPSPSKRVGTAGTPASPSPLRGSSSIVEEGSDQYGQLGRQDETTFHRRLRTLLWDHRAAREAWEDLVSMQGAKSVASLARLAAQLDELMANGGKLADRYDALPAMLRLTQAEADARRAEEMATVWTKLQLEKDTLDGVIVKLGKPISRLEALSDAAETLLVDITRTKGDQFAFEQEAWTTWPMARFIFVVQNLTSRFVVQTDHLRLLSSIVADQGCAPGKRMEKEENRARLTEAEDEDVESEEDEEDERDLESSGAKAARKARALVRQRVLEEWQALPMLSDGRTGQDANWFEDICEAEVGRWEER